MGGPHEIYRFFSMRSTGVKMGRDKVAACLEDYFISHS